MFVTSRMMMQNVGRNRAKTIGFIGLGAMGREMATNLLSKTFQASNDAELTFVVHDTMDQVSYKITTEIKSSKSETSSFLYHLLNKVYD